MVPGVHLLAEVAQLGVERHVFSEVPAALNIRADSAHFRLRTSGPDWRGGEKEQQGQKKQSLHRKHLRLTLSPQAP